MAGGKLREFVDEIHRLRLLVGSLENECGRLRVRVGELEGGIRRHELSVPFCAERREDEELWELIRPAQGGG